MTHLAETKTQVLLTDRSKVRRYRRWFPFNFAWLKKAQIPDESSSAYIDFFARAGCQNEGHNQGFSNHYLRTKITLDRTWPVLDLFSSNKYRFHTSFQKLVPARKNRMNKTSFLRPSGPGAMKAALRLTFRAMTGRRA